MPDNIMQFNQDSIKYDLKDIVHNSVKETLNALLVKETDGLVNAQKYERSAERQGYRSGRYKRNFHTTAGEVEQQTIIQRLFFCLCGWRLAETQLERRNSKCLYHCGHWRQQRWMS